MTAIEDFDATVPAMDIECLRTFLEVAANGSFTTAASRLNLAQSTISARIRGLEDQLGQALFVRDRDGVSLTSAGKQLLRHASAITRTWEQARHDIAIPEGYEALLRLTAPAYLWDRIILRWIPWMRARRPSVALRLEGSFPDSAIDQLAEGLLDICILYLPRPRPGVMVETLADEPVVLVQHGAQTRHWSENYILVDWGPEFRVEHERAFAGMTKPAISTGLIFVGLRYVLNQEAAGYLPLSEVASYVERGELKLIEDAPVFHRPVYLAYPAHPPSSDTLEIGLAGLRMLGKDWASPRQNLLEPDIA
jgi:LysR family transcriptional regulator, flagellar master operon regulator